MRVQSTLHNSFAIDFINRDLCSFSGPNTIAIVPDLADFTKVCRGSINSESKFIGCNIDQDIISELDKD